MTFDASPKGSPTTSGILKICAITYIAAFIWCVWQSRTDTAIDSLYGISPSQRSWSATIIYAAFSAMGAMLVVLPFGVLAYIFICARRVRR